MGFEEKRLRTGTGTGEVVEAEEEDKEEEGEKEEFPGTRPQHRWIPYSIELSRLPFTVSRYPPPPAGILPGTRAASCLRRV